MKKNILIIGFGSVGKRHSENFSSLGCNISIVEVNEIRIIEASSKANVKAYYQDINEALYCDKFDGAIICSPTLFHPKQSLILIQAGIPVLVEKPLAINLFEANRLKYDIEKCNGKLLLGYTWRWWEPIRILKQMLFENLIGEVRHVHFNMSAHLADWHPWERYQDFFMSSKKLGGGALLDESHWIDIMIWIFGMPNSISGHVSKISELEIETDDNVDLLCHFDSLSVKIHLDLFGRPHDKSIRFVGDKGSILWTAEPNRISVCNQAIPIWEEYNYEYERNDMFTSLAKEFIDVIDDKLDISCSVDDGINVLKIIEAARKSTTLKKTIKL
jgi:predicted dehydrogenase